MHSFLLDQDGELTQRARDIPMMRNWIQSLPDTRATFRLCDMPVNPSHTPVELVEFLKAWQVDEEIYGASGNTTRFVNPNYVHSHTYSDSSVVCDCGARFTHNYETAGNLTDEHEHSRDCKPHNRLRARADMAELRDRMIRRLTALGWKGPDIGARLGVVPTNVSSIAAENGHTLTKLREQYRRNASKTYVHLVRTKGVSASVVSDIYDHAPTTLSRWANEHDVETPDGYEFVKGNRGKWTWALQSD